MKTIFTTSILLLALLWPTHSTYAVENGYLRPLAAGEERPRPSADSKGGPKPLSSTEELETQDYVRVEVPRRDSPHYSGHINFAEAMPRVVRTRLMRRVPNIETRIVYIRG